MRTREIVTPIDPYTDHERPYNIYCADGGVPDSARNYLEKNFKGVNLTGKDKTSREELLTLLKLNGDQTLDALWIRSATDLWDEELLQAITESRLRYIARLGIGADNINQEALAEAGVACANTPEGNALSVLHLTLQQIRHAYSLATLGDLNVARDNKHKKLSYSEKTDPIEGKIFGIVGLGNIGGRVARALKELKGEIVGYDPFKQISDIRSVELEELFRISDVVSLHPALNETSDHMVTEKLINRMKPNAYLINNSRGQVVNEKALHEAIASGAIAGAYLDVLTIEGSKLKVGSPEFQKLSPDKQKHVEEILLPLINHKLVHYTEHSGGNSDEAIYSNGLDAARQTMEFAELLAIRNGLNFPPAHLDNGTDLLGTFYRVLVLNRNRPHVHDAVKAALGSYEEELSLDVNIEGADNKSRGNLAALLTTITFREQSSPDKIRAISYDQAKNVVQGLKDRLPDNMKKELLGFSMVQVDRYKES